MNLKSLAALALATSAVPFTSAGIIAYGICQTGQVTPTIAGFVLIGYAQAATALQSPAMLLPDSRLG